MIGSIVASYVAAVFILIILFGLYTNLDKRPNLNIIFFRICAWFCFSALVLDGTFYLVKYINALNSLGPLFAYFSYIMTDGIIIFFALYFQSIAEKDRKVPGPIIKATIIISCVDFVIFTVFSLMKKIFYYYNGATVPGPWYGYVVVCPVICEVLLFIYAMTKRKSLGRKYLMTLSSFYVFTFTGIILICVFPFFNASYVSTAFAICLNYVLIQSKIIAEANVRAETYNSLSVRDFLTGLKNRRGFHEMEAQLDPHAEVEVLFCDINGLKLTNDNYGHKDGDLMIQKMANLLTENFPDGESFRMSGDEFIVIIDKKQGVDSRIEKFREVLSENGDIAVFGCSEGSASELDVVVRQAETRMYTEKKLYYARTGRNRS